jgi:hypothetical protein
MELIYFCYKFEFKKLLIIILSFHYIILFLKTNINCDNFYNGIGGNKLINDPNLDFCFIKKPRTCGQDLLSGLFDANIFRKNGCKDINNKKSIFLKYLEENLKIYNNYSFPRTEHWDPKFSYRNLANIVEKNIKEANENNSQDNEIFVSFNKGLGNIEIKLKKNKTLINEKRKLSRKYPVKFNNIYMIYLDAISRNNFIRKLKKSTKIIEQILYTNKNKEKQFQNYNAFQFFIYHNFNGVTQGNFFPIFYGNNRKSLKGISILKFFNEKGFITAAAHNSCNKEIFDWPKVNKSVEFSEFDHENVAMFCDPNFEDKNHKWSMRSGKSSIFRKCLYGRDSFKYNFEYILQFLEAYKNERKFFRITFGDGHEGTNEIIKYIDNSLSSFILKILKNYFDDKTALIILSDHGPNIPGPYDILFYEEKMTEQFLGLLLFIIPNVEKYNSSDILFNQQQFITTYDIHDTLLDMININKYKNKNILSNKGQSLFKKIKRKSRSCLNFTVEIKDCFCQNYYY